MTSLTCKRSRPYEPGAKRLTLFMNLGLQTDRESREILKMRVRRSLSSGRYNEEPKTLQLRGSASKVGEGCVTGARGEDRAKGIVKSE